LILVNARKVRKLDAVKILKFQNKSKATKLAKSLISEAKKNEPEITGYLKLIASANKAKLVGLKNKFKSEHSLTRKLRDLADTIENVPIETQAERIDDALRYTMILAADDYKECYQKILRQLEYKGFSISNIWNAWEMAETPIDTGYRGINVSIFSSQNQKFELQFHTKDSFKIKTETHNLYEERRNPKTSLKRIQELQQIGIENANSLKKPKGI
jgi:hypothetical protein